MAEQKIVILVTCLCVILSFPHAFGAEGKTTYVYKDSENGFSISSEEPPDGSCAQATYLPSFNTYGWDFLNITAIRDRYVSDDLAFCAGYLEASLTYESIYNHWYNTLSGVCPETDNSTACINLNKYLTKNYNWNKQMIAKYKNTDPYWYQVSLFYQQINGLAEGYKKFQTDHTKQLAFRNILMLNIQGDIDDVLQNYNINRRGQEYESNLVNGVHLPGARSCSALVKLLPDSRDLYTSHDTWSSFQSMLRVLKIYNLDYAPTAKSPQQDTLPGRVVSFSSYPGEIQSGDDFYITSAGLTVMETTIGNNNASLWNEIKPEWQVLEQIRVVVANRLATSGREWSKIFSQYNSGTYNNQWMVVDYKNFKVGTPQHLLKNDLLWIIEQIPGFIKAADKTDVLREQSYWPSYNSPYFPEVFNLSENFKLVEKYGDWFSYDKTPRALIFKRDHVKVTDVPSMISLMRYIDYKNDPLSRCNCTPPYSAENTIACRSDLNPANGTYPFPSLGHRSHSATDMKLTTSELVKTFQFWAVSGPPFNKNTPPFQWSKSDYNDLPHLGQPDLWQFEPILTNWSLNSFP